MEISTSRWRIKTKTISSRCSNNSSTWCICSSLCKAASRHSSRCSTIRIIRWRNNSNLWTKVMPGTGSQAWWYRRVSSSWCSSKCLRASTWSTSKWLTWDRDQDRSSMIQIWCCSNSRWWVHPIRASNNKMLVEVRAARQQWWNNSQVSRCNRSSKNSYSNRRLLKLKRNQAADSTWLPPHSISQLKSSFLLVPLLKRMNSSLDSAS